MKTFYVTWHTEKIFDTTDWFEAIIRANQFSRLGLTGIAVTTELTNT
jgi:hypothetical protein